MAVFKILLLGAVLGLAHGASVATAEAKKSNCTMADGFQAITCLFVSSF